MTGRREKKKNTWRAWWRGALKEEEVVEVSAVILHVSALSSELEQPSHTVSAATIAIIKSAAFNPLKSPI